ncbi:MAG: hypothetical protein VB862_15720, partial [Pirellulaceae bacterium]
MMIANCPNCEDKITIPDGARENSNVACPLCRDEFLLSEVLQTLPPRLILLDSPAEWSNMSDTEKTSSLGIVDETAKETEQIEVPAEESPSDSEPDSSKQEDSFGFSDSGESGAVAPTSIRSSRRSRQESENPLGTVIKVALGGLMAVPLAQLILWWGFSRDPVKLGPKVPSVIRWVVPKDLRGSTTSQAPSKANRDDLQASAGWQRLVRD